MQTAILVALVLLALISGCTSRSMTGPAATPASTQGTKMNPALENTYWKLIQLGDRSDIVGKDQQEPNITLRPDQKRIAGTGGCNRLMGAYSLEEDRLRFAQLGSTMMACPQGMEQEKAFADALQKVTHWRIVAGKLELLDDSGSVLARFEARD
jgi:heat shock protein HslJ